MKHFTPAIFAFLLIAAAASAHESPVDHVDRAIRLWFEKDALHLSYRMELSERSVLVQFHVMDANQDGSINEQEKKIFFNDLSAKLAALLRVEIDGKPREVTPNGPIALDSSLGQTFTFVAKTGPLSPGKHAGLLMDYHSRDNPGPYRWIGTHAQGRDGVLVEPAGPIGFQSSEGHPGMVILKFAIVVPTS